MSAFLHLVIMAFLPFLPLNIVIEGHISLTSTDHVEYKQVWDWTMLKPCPFHSLFTLCKLKTSVSFKKASWHTIPIWPNTHLFLSLTLFRPKYLYKIATIVFLRYWRHWPSFSFIAIWYQMILQVVNTSLQWVENIYREAFLFFKRIVKSIWF